MRHYTPAAPWTLACPWCPWSVLVYARGARGSDNGSGFEAAALGAQHAELHGKTWREFLDAESHRKGTA